MVFGKQARVFQKDMDKYDRVVGIVYVGGTCVNEIVKAGMAWVYDYYCKDSVCPDWKQNEEQAQGARIGLWSHPDPIPPWTIGEATEGSQNQKRFSQGHIMAISQRWSCLASENPMVGLFFVLMAQRCAWMFHAHRFLKSIRGGVHLLNPVIRG